MAASDHKEAEETDTRRVGRLILRRPRIVLQRLAGSRGL